jgi:carbonic anhydrase
VVSILVEEAGEGHPPTQNAVVLLRKLIGNFPPPAEHPTVTINTGALLPPDARPYFKYAGSLTTPPCDEGVEFYVLKTPIYILKSQIGQFARRFPSPNARDIQETNGRPIQKETR